MSDMHQSMNQAAFLVNLDTEPVLHAIDFEDVALTSVGVRMVRLGARAIMRQFMPAADSDRLTSSEAVAMFVDRVFWEEHSGGLILCTDLAERSLCLPIPRQHWTVRGGGGRLH